jgi:hypothetical protein
MALFAVVIPGNFSCDATSPDQVLRDVTTLFGLYSMYAAFSDPHSGVLSDLVIRQGHEPGAICARSGNWFPGEQLAKDGQGRTVGKRFVTEGPAMPVMPPFPTFSK